MGYRGLASYHTLAKASQLSMGLVSPINHSFFSPPSPQLHHSQLSENARGGIQSAELTHGSFLSYQALVTPHGALAKLSLYVKACAHGKKASLTTSG